MSGPARTIMEWGSDWLESQRDRHMTNTILYARGGTFVGIQATPDHTTFDIDDGTGVIVQDVSRDFIVLAADLALDGKNIEPRRGDRITETIRGRVFVYEVTAPGKDQPWRWSDQFGTAYRIHTKRIQS